MSIAKGSTPLTGIRKGAVEIVKVMKGTTQLFATGGGGGGGGSFSPTSVTPGVWLDPSDLTTLYTDAGVTNVSADGQAVYRVTNKGSVGGHFEQATLSKRPLYRTSGGLHWLDFDGTDDCVATASFAAWAQANHFIAGIKFDALPSAKGFDGIIVDGIDGSNRNDIYVSSAGGDFRMFAGLGELGSGITATTSAAVVTSLFDGSASQQRVNGAAGSSGDPGSHSVTGLTVGSRFSQDSLWFDGRLYGLIARDAVFSDTDRNSVEAWMAAKAGI